MLRKALLVLIALALFVTTTSFRKYKIDPKIKEWIPYKPGQQIVFTSMTGKTDTLFILEKTVVYNPNDPLAIFPDNYQKLLIQAKVPSSWTNLNGTKFNYSFDEILIVDAHKKSTSLQINFKPYQYKFCNISNAIDILQTMPIKRKLGNRTYSDLIVLRCNNSSMCSSENSINEIYWSQEFGIVYYKLGQEEWSMKEVLNP